MLPINNISLFFSDAAVDIAMPSPCSASSHAISVKAFRWRTRSDHITRKASVARNNAAYGQGNGKTVVPYSRSLSLETVDTVILLLAVFTLDLEMDHPSETSLCTVAPSPQTPLLRFFSEGKGQLYTGYLERIILSSKGRRIFYSKLKLVHCQIKTYHLSDANHQTDNPSHTNNPSLV